MSRAFVDTNVFVHAFDDAEPLKRDLARELLEAEHDRVVISAQVLGEFFTSVTRKLPTPVAAPPHCVLLVPQTPKPQRRDRVPGPQAQPSGDRTALAIRA